MILNYLHMSFTTIQVQSLFSEVSLASNEEFLTTLFEKPGLRIERIISHGQASPEGFWYDQPQDEWVLLIRGSATLEIEARPPLTLQLGDHVTLPSHTRHRVLETSPDALWLAVHADC
jgi:cupin 2 domain-containing protein